MEFLSLRQIVGKLEFDSFLNTAIIEFERGSDGLKGWRIAD